LGTLLLFLWATTAHAWSILEFTEGDDSEIQHTDPPLKIDTSIDRKNPLANIDPAFNWPDYSDDADFDPS
jgi:hypothetical protein